MALSNIRKANKKFAKEHKRRKLRAKWDRVNNDLRLEHSRQRKRRLESRRIVDESLDKS